MNFPKTSGQCKYMLALRSNKPIVVCTGPAGSGKTMLACQVAIEQINKGKVILTRPIVAADEDMGYLPGDLNEKMEPWTRCFFDIFEKYLTHNQMDRAIRIEPLGYMRGRTFEDTLILADEMQNSTENQMLMLLTRVGPRTRIVITGDLQQSDLGDENGLRNLAKNLSLYHTDYIEHVDMDEDDIIRHPAVNEVLKILQN
jgi:phosphate starvation-inducible protein PhoH and related proteins